MFCVAEPRFAAASLAYQLADMTQTVPGLDPHIYTKKDARIPRVFLCIYRIDNICEINASIFVVNTIFKY